MILNHASFDKTRNNMQFRTNMLQFLFVKLLLNYLLIHILVSNYFVLIFNISISCKVMLGEYINLSRYAFRK